MSHIPPVPKRAGAPCLYTPANDDAPPRDGARAAECVVLILLSGVAWAAAIIAMAWLFALIEAVLS